MASADGIPSLRIKLDDQVILEQDMNDYVDRITAKYPMGSQGGLKEAKLDDMSVKFENEEVSVLLVFSNIDITLDPRADKINYWLNLNMLYFKEK